MPNHSQADEFRVIENLTQQNVDLRAVIRKQSRDYDKQAKEIQELLDDLDFATNEIVEKTQKIQDLERDLIAAAERENGLVKQIAQLEKTRLPDRTMVESDDDDDLPIEGSIRPIAVRSWYPKVAQSEEESMGENESEYEEMSQRTHNVITAITDIQASGARPKLLPTFGSARNENECLQRIEEWDRYIKIDTDNVKKFVGHAFLYEGHQKLSKILGRRNLAHTAIGNKLKISKNAWMRRYAIGQRSHAIIGWVKDKWTGIRRGTLTINQIRVLSSNEWSQVKSKFE